MIVCVDVHLCLGLLFGLVCVYYYVCWFCCIMSLRCRVVVLCLFSCVLFFVYCFLCGCLELAYVRCVMCVMIVFFFCVLCVACMIW